MTLRDACEIAVDCGLETVGEAVYNIDLHAPSLFAYSEVALELEELHREAEDYDENTSVYDIIGE